MKIVYIPEEELTYDLHVSHLTKEELSDPDHVLEEKPFRLPFLTGSNIGYKRL